MFGICSSSAKTKVLGSAVARVTKSAAARGDFASLDNKMYDSSALIARCCSMAPFARAVVVEEMVLGAKVGNAAVKLWRTSRC